MYRSVLANHQAAYGSSLGPLSLSGIRGTLDNGLSMEDFARPSDGTHEQSKNETLTLKSQVYRVNMINHVRCYTFWECE